MDGIDDEMTLEQMAEKLGVAPKTLRNRICDGRDHPPYYKPTAGDFRFPVRDYLQWRRSKIERARVA